MEGETYIGIEKGKIKTCEVNLEAEGENKTELHSTKRILTATPTIYSQTRKWEECTKKVPREETEKHKHSRTRNINKRTAIVCENGVVTCIP